MKDSINRFNDFYKTLEDPVIYPPITGKDPVLVIPFEGGGLISYRHEDGFLVHTLNNRDGFVRKMEDIGKIPRKIL